MKKCKIFFVSVFFCFFYNHLTSQTVITGNVKTVNNEPIYQVNVIVKDQSEKTIVNYTSTNEEGAFSLTINKTGKLNLTFSLLGFETQNIPIDILKLGDKSFSIVLKEKSFELNEVVVKSERSIKIKKDTIVFNVKSFTKGNEEVVEDLLKNIPGLDVDADGTIKIGNQEIEKVMVDGDDFFEKGYKVLTKNLPPNPIDKVEVLKNYSNNKHLKGVEESEKVALNLVLKEDAKRVWFGNAVAGYGIASENRYTFQSNLANFGKKNKYYFITNMNNIGSDATGDISNLMYSFRIDQPSSIGDNEKVNNLLGLDAFIPNFKDSRTNLNNTELVSLNAIFNPTKKLRIKPIVFLNWDENDFFRNSTENFQTANTTFSNTENFSLRKKRITGFGKLDITYNASKKSTLEIITKYNRERQNNISDLIFNNRSTIEHFKSKKTLFDNKATFTSKLNKNRVILATSRYIYESLPENYSINQFLYDDLFPNVTSNNIAQINDNNMTFWGLEGHLLDRRKKGNLLEVQIGNQLRKDNLTSSFQLKDDNFIAETPNDYQNNLSYLSNDLYLKTKYLLKLNKKVSFNANLGVHQLFNRFNKSSEQQFFVNPKLGFTWKINNNNKISSSYSYNTTNSKILDIYDNFILRGFRSFSKGTGQFNLLNSSSAFFNYTFGNWGSRFFANTSIVYNKNHDFFSTNSIINQNYSQAEKILIKDRDFLSINSSIDRYFKFISSNLKLDFGISSANYKNIVNSSNLREVISKNYSYGLELRSGFNSFFNYHIGTKWLTNQIKTSTSNSFTNNISFLDLSFTFDKVNADFQLERYAFGNVNKDNSAYYFADFNLRYTLKKNKTKLSLTGKNLFNTNRFKELRISDIGTSTNEYRLVPRYILLKFDYRF
ncbi:carboxypeptidase-like regulatory domain-containing protein [Tenacibaculum sp. MEBiC06402]|uniref:carboxypeptidase-like regulatory domain-containing protein n=1 Tax=unclassified Tenacibaculum TaxID=2635139 RepID=UPI003B992DBA